MYEKHKINDILQLKIILNQQKNNMSVSFHKISFRKNFISQNLHKKFQLGKISFLKIFLKS